MIKSLIKEIKRDDNNKTLRSIIITSKPGKIFSAGHNIKELVSKRINQLHEHADPVFVTFFEND